jgi:signal transduction histidine kinase
MKVTERTRQLRDVNAELQRLDKTRRQFLADVGHELKTPLTVIRGEAEVTLRGPEKEGREYRECLQRIGQQAVQLDRLVSDLLFLARAESGHLDFEWSLLDFVEVAGSVADDLRVIAQTKSIAVNWTRPDLSAWVRGDRSRLRQALLVIGENACRYSPSGSEIALSVESFDKEARFAVVDHGIGIPGADMEKIFDRYFRSANARRSSQEGTGLGLPVAHAIVKAHGGQISVTSGPEAGTAFSVALPLAEADDGANPGIESITRSL